MAGNTTLQRLQMEWSEARNHLDDFWHHGHPVDARGKQTSVASSRFLEQTGDEFLAIAKESRPVGQE